ALTNVVKHAVAQTVDVRLRYRESSLEIEVTDDGRGSVGVVDQSHSDRGFGLVGMQERVAVHDGELEVGPRAAGGYRVRAVFPTPSDSQMSRHDVEVTAS